MNRIEFTDLQNIAEYEKVRPEFRKDVMVHKARRRAQLGPNISLTFEDRQTIIYQIQEMMRTERMVRDEQIQEEIDIYNSLIPDAGELSATLFIEITAEEQIRERLHQFIGLTDGKSLWLEVDGARVYAQFEAGRSKEDRISSVHYVRFRLTPAMEEKLPEENQPAELVVEHGGYRHRFDLTPAMRQSLCNDLALSESETQ